MSWRPERTIDPATALQAAHDLATSLEAGVLPEPIAPPPGVRLRPEEACYAWRPASARQHTATDAEYVHKTRFGLSPTGLALAAATAVGNSARKAKAARQARPQWRDLGTVRVFLTNHRLLLQHGGDWHSIWHNELINLSCDGRAIFMQKTGNPLSSFEADAIDYFFILWNWFAYGQVARPPR